MRSRRETPASAIDNARFVPEWQKVPHILIHAPKYASCPVCARALTMKKPSRRVKPKEDEAGKQPQQFGEVITADHIVNRNEHDSPMHAHKVASVMYDRGTERNGAFPRVGRNLAATMSACNLFVGPSEKVQ